MDVIPSVGCPVVWYRSANPNYPFPALVAGKSDLGFLTLVVFEPSRVRQIMGVPYIGRVDELKLSAEDRARIGAWGYVPELKPKVQRGDDNGRK